MSFHLSAKPGEIAKAVVLPGDPIRAAYIANKFLEKPAIVSTVRNNVFYTGTYRGKPMTVGASGMGIPSIGIYSYELYHGYDVDCIIRVGTAGAYAGSMKLFDIINADRAYSESTYAQLACGMMEDTLPHPGPVFDILRETAKELGIPLINGDVHSSDAFYRAKAGIPDIARERNLLAVEMEAFALFANAATAGRTAGALLTISDSLLNDLHMTNEEKEHSLDNAIRIALEAAWKLS